MEFKQIFEKKVILETIKTKKEEEIVKKEMNLYDLWMMIKSTSKKTGINIEDVVKILSVKYGKQIKHVFYLHSNDAEYKHKRRCFFIDLIEGIVLDDIIIEEYVKYMESLHPTDRFTYISKLSKYNKDALKEHILEMYDNKISELGRELMQKHSDEFNEKKRKNTDLYEFKNDYKLMLLLVTALKKKIDMNKDKEKRRELYFNHTGVNIAQCYEEGYSTPFIYSLIRKSFIERLSRESSKTVNKYIDDLVNPDIKLENIELI